MLGTTLYPHSSFETVAGIPHLMHVRADEVQAVRVTTTTIGSKTNTRDSSLFLNGNPKELKLDNWHRAWPEHPGKNTLDIMKEAGKQIVSIQETPNRTLHIRRDAIKNVTSAKVNGTSALHLSDDKLVIVPLPPETLRKAIFSESALVP